jgi:hypothetical protein
MSGNEVVVNMYTSGKGIRTETAPSSRNTAKGRCRRESMKES